MGESIYTEQVHMHMGQVQQYPPSQNGGCKHYSVCMESYKNVNDTWLNFGPENRQTDRCLMPMHIDNWWLHMTA